MVARSLDLGSELYALLPAASSGYAGTLKA